MTYSQEGYVTAPYTVPARRPPLERRARRGAMVAGGVGFTMWNLGWSILGLAAFVSFFAAILSVIANSSRANSEEFAALGDFEAAVLFTPGAGIALLIAIVVGVVLVVLSILSSGWILKAHGVRSRWGVTWAGIGISVIVNWIVGTIISVIGQVAGVLGQVGQARSEFTDPNGIDLAPVIAGIIIWVVVALVAQALIAIFAWWWMAHAMRPRTSTTTEPATTLTENH